MESKLTFIDKKNKIVEDKGMVVCTSYCTLNLEKKLKRMYGINEIPERVKRIIKSVAPTYKFSDEKGHLIDANREAVDGFRVTAVAKCNKIDGDNFDVLTGRILAEGRAKEKAYNTANAVCSAIYDELASLASEFCYTAIQTEVFKKSEHKRIRKTLSRLNKSMDKVMAE